MDRTSNITSNYTSTLTCPLCRWPKRLSDVVQIFLRHKNIFSSQYYFVQINTCTCRAWWWPPRCRRQAAASPGTSTCPCPSARTPRRWRRDRHGYARGTESRHGPASNFASKYFFTVYIHKLLKTISSANIYSIVWLKVRKEKGVCTLEMMMPAMEIFTLGPCSSL